MSTTVIIGANRGIGLELTRAHAARDGRVIAVCRRKSAELAGLGTEIIEGIDVGEPSTLSSLCAALADQSINRLIVVAGILSKESLDNLDEDAFSRIQRQFEINSIGPLRVVSALQPMLARGGQIGILTSRMGSIADNSSGGYYGYRASKAAVNAIGRSLAHDLREAGVSVVLLHPGFVRTEMTGGNGDVTPAQSAAGLIRQLDALNADGSGSFRHANGDALPW